MRKPPPEIEQGPHSYFAHAAGVNSVCLQGGRWPMDGLRPLLEG